MKYRKATVQLTFSFPKDFTDDDLREHVGILLKGGLDGYEKRIEERSFEKPKDDRARYFRNKYLKQLRLFRARYKAALKTLTFVRLED
jgi:hypothetical protein